VFPRSAGTQANPQNTDNTNIGIIIVGALGGLSVICVTVLFYLYIKGKLGPVETRKTPISAELDKEFLLDDDESYVKVTHSDASMNATLRRPLSTSSSFSSVQTTLVPSLHQDEKQSWRGSSASLQSQYEDPYTRSQRPEKEIAVVLQHEQEGLGGPSHSTRPPLYAP
jgi:hypothetical protein